MDKKFSLRVSRLPAAPRSPRLRQFGGAVSVGSTNITVNGSESVADPNSHSHANKADLDRISLDDGYAFLLALKELADGSGWESVREKIKAGFADRAAAADFADRADLADRAVELTPDSPTRRDFISRIFDDTAAGLVTFLRGLVSDDLARLNQGAHFGSFIRSMVAGSGAGIDHLGNAQVESIEVRSYMLVMELILNRLSAVESDFVFNEGGTVESALQLPDDSWLLTFRKRWDYDFVAFQPGDVLYGSVNTLLSDGSYFTSWMRVNSVDTSANQVNVSIYPDNEVPAGRNFFPCAGMNVLHRGNDRDELRQSAWYLSSREGCICYLEGVTKPILEQSNYYLIIGKLKRLDIFSNFPINYNHPYIYCRGILAQEMMHIDYQGNPVYEVVDIGPWRPDMQYIRGYDPDASRYIQHQVWHNSCAWRCVAPAADVGVPPRWNSTQWVCVVNDNFSLEIVSSAGHFLRAGREFTDLSFILRHGDDDVSVDAWQIEWTRISGNPAEDLLWNSEHASAGAVLHISPADMPSDWFSSRRVSFRCSVFVRDGVDGDPDAVADFSFSA